MIIHTLPVVVMYSLRMIRLPLFIMREDKEEIMLIIVNRVDIDIDEDFIYKEEARSSLTINTSSIHNPNDF